MPRTSEADWMLAQSLFVEGIPHKEICARIGVPLGTLRKRATRMRWTELRQKTIAVTGPPAARDLVTIAQEIRHEMADDALEAVRALRKLPHGNTIEKLSDREQVAGALVKRAWQTLGLDQAANTTIVNVALMSTLSDYDDERAQTGHTVDVTATVSEAREDVPSPSAPPAPAGPK